MKIAQIRDVIRSGLWLRNDFAGHTSEEFVRANVAYILNQKIDELQALVIPARFADELARRDEEIASCRKVIARWEVQVLEHTAELFSVKNPSPHSIDTRSRLVEYISQMPEPSRQAWARAVLGVVDPQIIKH